MGDTDDRMQFSRFVNKLRKKKNLTMEKLCDGLCSPRTAWYLESGERMPDKLVQDAILERLGIGAEDYEHFLDYEEYGHWEARQHILHSITFGETERAECLLEEYSAAYDMGDKLEKQFYLSMLAQVRRCQGGREEELRALAEEAVCQTVPLQESLAGLVLSVKELNLILEAERCRGNEQRPERYQEIAEYIEANGFDRRSRAKIYPKAVFFLCCCAMAREAQPDQRFFNYLLKYCNDALEVLRDNGRMYYLWEILDMREKLLGRMMEELAAHGSRQKADSLCSMYQENRAWRQVLEAVYAEFRVPKETFEYCYLYVVKGVSCINDIIRIRRGMLGMSQKELCEGICDVKTLRRIEGRKTSPHREIVRELFERLGLSGEFTRTELVTDNPEVNKLAEQLREFMNAYRFQEANSILSRLKQLASIEIKSNQQNLMRKELLMLWKTGKLQTEEYLKQMHAVLELTIPYETFLREGEKYLTYSEQICIQNMMQAMDPDGEELFICMRRFEELYHYYIEKELLETVVGVYELIFILIASLCGNRGEYDRADQYTQSILQGCLRFRRMWIINDCLYDRWWNYAERKKKGIPTAKTLNDVKELTQCILFSRLSKGLEKKIYHKKLDQIMTENTPF